LGELTALVLQAESERYFVVGANIRALETLNAGTIVEWVERGHSVFNRLEALPLPVIARIDGFALGGGLELAMACDLIVATESAKFGQPEANLGLVAGWGGTRRLPQRIGTARAKELFFTGRAISAETALAYGLINFVGHAQAVDTYLDHLFEEMRPLSASAIGHMKHLVNISAQITQSENCAAEADASQQLLSGADTQKRVASFLDSRKPR
jgi:enoyl-CoA hydratase